MGYFSEMKERSMSFDDIRDLMLKSLTKHDVKSYNKVLKIGGYYNYGE